MLSSSVSAVPMARPCTRLSLPTSRTMPPAGAIIRPRTSTIMRVLEVERTDAEVASSARSSSPPEPAAASTSDISPSQANDVFEARKKQRQREQLTYQVSAVAATSGVVALAIVATYLRFEWHHDDDIPWIEVMGTLSLVAGGVFGMEMWARWAHRVLWHDYEPGWALHKSHHEPRTGPFEANDIFAIINGVPAMALCLYGFLTPGVPGGLSFGAGLGITLFGIMYMFIHDGMVHKRFPVGPLADLPQMKRIAVAHKLHHAEKYGGAPWGMFLGPQELEAIPGASEELDRLVADLDSKKGVPQ